MYEYRRRNRLLRKRSGTGYDESFAPTALALTVIISSAVMYGGYLYRAFGNNEADVVSMSGDDLS